MDKKVIAAIAAVAVMIIAGTCIVMLTGPGDHNADAGARVGEAIAGEKTPSTDSRLWVYGNVNEDDRLDQNDRALLVDILAGKANATQLADVNADGVLNDKDLAYLDRIIAGDKMDVYYIDNYYKIAKVGWPVGSIAIGYCSGAYTADVTGLCDKVAMVDATIASYWKGMNPAFAAASSFGVTETPDYEAMIKKNIDVYVVGYCDSTADPISPGKLNPAGIDVMFMSTADNSGVDYPNESIDRSILMFGFLLQGDMDKAYKYLEWHDKVLGKLKEAGSKISEEDKAAFMMARSSMQYESSTVSITGLNNTNNIHAEWVGVHAIGQHSATLSKNYNKLTPEQVLTVVLNDNNKQPVVYYMDNEHDGMRHQRDLDACIAADREMLSTSTVPVHYLGMAREAGNSPLYVVELAFYQNVMYPGLTAQTGLDYKELFSYYFDTFASYDYSALVNLGDFFYDYGV
jgi:hypothetical protein